MIRVLPLVNPYQRFRSWAANGGPISIWSPVSRGGSELSWVLAGKFGLMGGNGVVMLFLAHRLELSTYGLLVITISSQLLISRLLMLGVDTGMVRLTALPDLRSRYQEVVTAGLVAIAFTTAALLVLSLLATPLLLRFQIAGWTIPCIIAGSIGTALVDYGYDFRLGRHQYQLAALAQGGTSIFRLASTILAAVTVASPIAVFAAYHGASLLSGLVQAMLIMRMSESWPERALIQRLLRYSFWQGKANVIVILSLYQGTFLLTILKQPAETGIFGLALTLSLGFFAIYNAYSEYLLVRIRAVEHMKALRRFITQAMTGAFVLVLVCVPILFALAKLVPWFLGDKWLEVVPTFRYLAAAMVLLILQAPLEAACHYILKPQLVWAGWIIRAVAISVLGILLVPQMGSDGAAVAAIAQVVGSAFALVILSLLVAAGLRSALRENG